MRPLPHPHRKQFIIGPAPVAVTERWKHVRLSDRLILSHCGDLSVEEARTLDGVRHYLIGLAVSINSEDPASEISNAPAHRTDEVTAFWAGRWALVSSDRCVSDAATCIGFHYIPDAEPFWVASSPALFSEIPGIACPPIIAWKIKIGRRMDWIPNPFTSRQGVYKVLPQRWIDPTKGTVGAQDALPQHGPGFAEALGQLMKNWRASSSKKKVIALTAGRDTRTVLAAAASTGTPFHAITGITPNLSLADRFMAPKLARAVGFTHSFAEPPDAATDAQAGLLDVVSRQMDGIFIHGAFEEFARTGDTSENIETAEGQVFELGRCYYWTKFRDYRVEMGIPTVDFLLDQFFVDVPEPIEEWRQALSSWVASLSEEVPLKMDWRDRLYLEQRLGAWFSTIHRLMDLMDRTAFYPANCLWIMHRLLQPSVEKRRRATLQTAAIAELAPPLSRFPINKAPFVRRLQRKLRLT